MELVNKKKSAEENTSSNELELENVSDSQIVQNNNFSNLPLDLYNLQPLKQKYNSSPFISYLSINSLSNKIDALRQICKTAPLEILFVDEPNLIVVFQILNSELTDTFSPLIGETEIITEGAKRFL